MVPLPLSQIELFSAPATQGHGSSDGPAQARGDSLAADRRLAYSVSPCKRELAVLNSAQVVGSLVACALVLGSFWGLFWLKKRRREERRERPPQREKLLRPAGYSAMRRIDALSEEWMSAAAQAIGTGVFFGLIAGTFNPLRAALALGQVTARPEFDRN